MSEENVETIRRGIDAYNRGDKAAWLDAYDADVVMIPAREWPESSPTRGREALWDFYMEALATWETAAIPELGEVIDSEDRVVGNSRYVGRGKSSGAPFDFNYWFVATFRNGRQSRVEWFSDREQALEAAGLSE